MKVAFVYGDMYWSLPYTITAINVAIFVLNVCCIYIISQTRLPTFTVYNPHFYGTMFIWWIWHYLHVLLSRRKICLNPPFLWICLYQVKVITVFPVFRLLTHFVCLCTYEFWFSLWKIVRSLVILLLPLLSEMVLTVWPLSVLLSIQLLCLSLMMMWQVRCTTQTNSVNIF